jgi:hypothetical protein
VILNAGVKTDAFIEITDLKTNEVLFVLQGSGWTEDCGFSKGGLFSNLAKEIDKTWKLHK